MSEEEEDSDEDGGWSSRKRVVYKKVQSPIRCRDGFEMSVQASLHRYCTPRDDDGPYSHVEVAFTSEWEDLLIPYRDKSEPAICGMRPALYVNVPAETVREVIVKHAGMTRGSGQLPRMIEVDEDGVQWAAAAEPPTSSDTGDSDSGMEADEEDDSRRSPYSAIHMGAPPPLSSSLPPTETGAATTVVGEITPPPQLRQMTMSPIETTHEEFNFE